MTHLSDQTLRIIDANMDRATEGLRVLEDVARFVLSSIPLSARLKSVRHRLHAAFPDFGRSLISARDSVGDVGRDSDSVKEPAVSLLDTVIANSRRVEQSLRVLEEISRLPDTATGSATFEESRYALYDLEKELVSRLSRTDKTDRLTGLYAIVVNVDDLLLALEQQAVVVELSRGKSTLREFWRLAEEYRERCLQSDTLFIIREHIDIALGVKSDGVVLNCDSLPLPVARKMLNIDQIIGYAVTSIGEALEADGCGADYIVCPNSLRTAVVAAVKIAVITPSGEVT